MSTDNIYEINEIIDYKEELIRLQKKKINQLKDKQQKVLERKHKETRPKSLTKPQR